MTPLTQKQRAKPTTANKVTGGGCGVFHRSASGVVWFDKYKGDRTPQYINWTVGIQRQVTHDISLTVSYVGSTAATMFSPPMKPMTKGRRLCRSDHSRFWKIERKPRMCRQAKKIAIPISAAMSRTLMVYCRAPRITVAARDRRLRRPHAQPRGLC